VNKNFKKEEKMQKGTN